MRKKVIISFLGIVGFLWLSPSCQREKGDKAIEIPPLVGSEVSVAKIQENLGCQFDILKTETIGYSPTHKFLWVSVDSSLDQKKVENLAHAMIQDIIAQKSGTYHSFTLHFFRKNDLAKTVESSEPFAKAEYLPEGGWVEVGRVPISQYQDYQLTCTFKE